MTRRLLIRPEAQSEIAEAFDWYQERAEGLGDEFVRVLDACLSSILRQPLAYPIVHRNARRALLRRFPYSILYIIEAQEDNLETIFVLACFHIRRDPRQWQKRQNN
jgi:plasmid stabilization system protein ParE